MARAPIYSPGDTVYLKDSAALGFLEAYIVQSIHHLPDSTIRYRLSTHLKPPTANMTMGDRNRGTILKSLSLFESELVPYCEALALAIDNVTKQLASLQAQFEVSGCQIDEGTEGTG